MQPYEAKTNRRKSVRFVATAAIWFVIAMARAIGLAMAIWLDMRYAG